MSTRTFGAAARTERHERARRLGHVFAVVEHQQRRRRAQVLGDDFRGGAHRVVLGSDGIDGGTAHVAVAARRGEVDEPHAVRETFDERSRHLASQAGLAHATRAGDGHEPVLAEQAD